MPAPTALQRVPDALAEETTSLSDTQPVSEDGGVVINTIATIDKESDEQPATQIQDELTETVNMNVDQAMEEVPESTLFSPEDTSQLRPRMEERKVRIPPHRMTPLKTYWPKIYPPLVEHLHLQVRMNIPKKTVELRTSKYTTSSSSLQKGADFLTAFTLGFDLDDAIALLRLDDLYIQSFEIKDVKMLNGEHLGRAVGRIAGKDGKTKFAIENASRTRIVLADQKVHILGGFKNIHVAQEAVVSLILGSPPGKVYGNLRTVSARMKERF